MHKLTIDLGKGVTLNAPIKLSMTLEEWIRMTNYINKLLEAQPEIKLQKAITITKGEKK